MKRLLMTLAFALCLCGSARGNQDVDGIWEGEIQDPRRPIVMTVDFTALRVSLSGAAPASLTRPTPTSDENTVKFEVPNGQQTLRFTGSRAGARISGEVDTGSAGFRFGSSACRPCRRQRTEAKHGGKTLMPFLPGSCAMTAASAKLSARQRARACKSCGRWLTGFPMQPSPSSWRAPSRCPAMLTRGCI